MHVHIPCIYTYIQCMYVYNMCTVKCMYIYASVLFLELATHSNAVFDISWKPGGEHIVSIFLESSYAKKSYKHWHIHVRIPNVTFI